MTASPDIQALIRRLRLSPGDVLNLAREVVEDKSLRSIDGLTRHQTEQFRVILEFLAQPIHVAQTPPRPRKTLHLAA